MRVGAGQPGAAERPLAVSAQAIMVADNDLQMDIGGNEDGERCERRRSHYQQYTQSQPLHRASLGQQRYGNLRLTRL